MSVHVPGRLLSETVAVKRHTDDGYGGSWSTSSEPNARVNHTQRMVRDDSGNEIVSGATVYLAGDADVQADDRLVVDGVRANADPPGRAVVTVARRRDPAGKVAMVEVTLQ